MPGNTGPNSWEQVKAVTLKIGKELQFEKEGTLGVVGEEKVEAENRRPSKVEDVTRKELVKE